MHSKVEETVFYPAMKAKTGRDGKKIVQNSVGEHEEIDGLISELKNTNPADPGFDQKFQELMDDVEKHIDEEESKLFPKAQMLGKELESLGMRIQKEKDGAQV